MVGISCWLGVQMAAGQTGGRAVDPGVEDIDPNQASLRVLDPGNAQFSNRVRVYDQGSHWWQSNGPAFRGSSSDVWNNGSNLGTHGAGQLRYRYHAPGVEAWTPRMDYFALRLDRMHAGLTPGFNQKPAVDGGAVNLIPAGTVFNLIPAHLPGPEVGMVNGQSVRMNAHLNMPEPVYQVGDTRVIGRLGNGPIDGRIGAGRVSEIPLDHTIQLQQPVIRILRKVEPAQAESKPDVTQQDASESDSDAESQVTQD